MLRICCRTLSLMVPEIIDSAPETRNPGTFECFSASYLASTSMFEKGESSTMHAIDGSLSEYISAVTAPILLPQSPIRETPPVFLK